jgi:glucose-6-phosphate 1-dehydrogenase
VICKNFFLRNKRKWFYEINLERKDFGEFHTLMQELRQNEKRFCIYFGIPCECFDEILSLIKEDITKIDTNYREAI